jgi:hypothetical protein
MLVIENIHKLRHEIVDVKGIERQYQIDDIKEVGLLDGYFYQFTIFSLNSNKKVHIFLNREKKGEKPPVQTYYHYQHRGEYYELTNSWNKDMVTINRDLVIKDGILMFMQKMLETIQ